MEIWIIRHGERIDAVDSNWITNTNNPDDPPLTQRGILQAKETGEQLKNILIGKKVIVFTSPFTRTFQTAEQICEQLSVPIFIEPGLCEFVNPKWFKQSPQIKNANQWFHNENKSNIQINYQPTINLPLNYPETLQQMDHRYVTTVKSIIQTYNNNPNTFENNSINTNTNTNSNDNDNDKNNIAFIFVSHGFAIQSIIQTFCPENFVCEAEYCCLSQLKWDLHNKQWNCLLLSSIQHLPPHLRN
eukprot:TRINITY_DN201_c0_g1_i1.p1 TRINITY_DN201_c0_g1~~TRINITY_DN201_c0_g1_i1.p1  ORF type:complete len:244 (-),score=106.49 TRINITY_DN201_c0_g1_i1:27-758(-)